MKNNAKRILKVLIYIEDYIHNEITVEELARVACYSPFHFQRVFRFIVGESVYQYMRRLRMEKAVAKLRYSDQSITDIALDANFGTPSAFTKAFKQCMGKSPKNYRVLYKELNIVEKRISDLDMIQPDEIKQVPDMVVLFIRRTGNYETSGKDAWTVLNAIIKKNNLVDTKLKRFTITYDDPKITDEKNLRLDACIQDNQMISTKGELARQTLPGGKYAIFTHHGPPNTLIDTYDRILFKWLPDSNENFDEKRFCFLEHINWINKVYIPLVLKNVGS